MIVLLNSLFINGACVLLTVFVLRGACLFTTVKNILYVDLPRRRMFWEQASDVHNELICSLMSCDRFEEIMKYIHLMTTHN